MRLFEVFEQTEPSDEELFGHSEPEKIRQAFISVIDTAFNNWQQYPLSASDYHALEATKYVFQTKGLIPGLRSLDHMSHGLIDQLDNDLAFDHHIILGQVEKKYLQGHSNAQPFQNTFIREEESDEELFGSKQEIKSNLSKVNTKTLLQMLHLSTMDTRPQYADAHALQASRIKRELRSRGVQLDENDSDEELFGKSDDNPYSMDKMIRTTPTETLKILLRTPIIDTRPEKQAEYAKRMMLIKRELLNRGVQLDEDEPTDDDLFGGKEASSDHAQKIANLIYDYAKESDEWVFDAVDTDVFTREEIDDIIEENQKMRYVSNLFRTTSIRIAMREFMKLWETTRSDIRQMAHTDGMDWIDDYIKAYGTLTNETTEPTDDDLFGDQNSLIRNRVIEAIKELQVQRREKFYEILNSMNVSSISDIDPDDESNWDILDEIEELNQHADIYERFIREFNTGLKQGLEYFAKSMSYALGGAHYEVAEFIEYHAMEKFGANLRDLTKQVLGVDIE